jgi:hypothetical protein
MPSSLIMRRVIRIALGTALGLVIFVAAFGLYLWRSFPLEKPTTMTTLVTAMEMYKLGYKSYPPLLSALGGNPEAYAKGATPTASCLIDDVLASGEKSGYRIRYKAIDTLSTGHFDAFTINADPLAPERPEQRHYFTDETGVVRVETGRPASAISPPAN